MSGSRPSYTDAADEFTAVVGSKNREARRLRSLAIEGWTLALAAARVAGSSKAEEAALAALEEIG